MSISRRIIEKFKIHLRKLPLRIKLYYHLGQYITISLLLYYLLTTFSTTRAILIFSFIFVGLAGVIIISYVETKGTFYERTDQIFGYINYILENIKRTLEHINSLLKYADIKELLFFLIIFSFLTNLFTPQLLNINIFGWKFLENLKFGNDNPLIFRIASKLQPTEQFYANISNPQLLQTVLICLFIFCSILILKAKSLDSLLKFMNVFWLKEHYNSDKTNNQQVDKKSTLPQSPAENEPG